MNTLLAMISRQLVSSLVKGNEAVFVSHGFKTILIGRFTPARSIVPVSTSQPAPASVECVFPPIPPSSGAPGFRDARQTVAMAGSIAVPWTPHPTLR